MLKSDWATAARRCCAAEGGKDAILIRDSAPPLRGFVRRRATATLGYRFNFLYLNRCGSSAAMPRRSFRWAS
jgi:hypothetical protein